MRMLWGGIILIEAQELGDLDWRQAEYFNEKQGSLRLLTLKRRAPVVLFTGPWVEPGPVAAVEVPGVVVGQEQPVLLTQQVRDPGVEPGRPDLNDVLGFVEIPGRNEQQSSL